MGTGKAKRVTKVTIVATAAIVIVLAPPQVHQAAVIAIVITTTAKRMTTSTQPPCLRYGNIDDRRGASLRFCLRTAGPVLNTFVQFKNARVGITRLV